MKLVFHETQREQRYANLRYVSNKNRLLTL